jgi:hypothetical protein
MTVELKMTWKGAIMALFECDFEYSPGICLERLRRHMRNLRIMGATAGV